MHLILSNFQMRRRICAVVFSVFKFIGYLQAKESSYQINQELQRKQNEFEGLSTEGTE